LRGTLLSRLVVGYMSSGVPRKRFVPYLCDIVERQDSKLNSAGWWETQSAATDVETTYHFASNVELPQHIPAVFLGVLTWAPRDN